jgi:PPM family protein phosphatase
VFQIESANLSDPGRKRQNNEDFIASFEPEDADELSTSGCLYIVADGVGGAIKGEKASRYAAQKVLFEYYRHPELPVDERLRVSMRQAGNDIFLYAQDNHESRMATTMVAASIRNDQLTVANVGDSRAYMIRGESIQQITHDHSLVGEMVRDGLMSEAESHNSKVKNLLTRSLGGELDAHIDIFPDISLQPGDRILLCSDGLSRYAQRDDLYAMTHQGAPEEVVKTLVGYANQRGGVDNTSVILIVVGETASGGVAVGPLHSKKQQALADWEKIPTLIEDNHASRKGLSKKNKKYLTWGGLVMAFLVVLGAVIFWLIKSTNDGNGVISLALTETRNATGITNAISETLAAESPTPIATNLATSAMTATAIVELLPTTTMIPTLSGDVATFTSTAVVSSTSTPLQPVCIYRASNIEGPTISKIFDEHFGIPYSNYYPNFFYHICTGAITWENCQPQLKVQCVNDICYINDEYFIEIPDVGKDECELKLGIFIQPP